MHELGELVQPQQYAYVYVQLSHSVDEHADKKHDGISQFYQKISEVFDTLHPNQSAL